LNPVFSGKTAKLFNPKPKGIAVMKSLDRTVGISALLAIALSFNAHALVFSIARGDSIGLANAIEAANRTAEPDVIELEAGLYTLKNPVAGKDGLVALPVITHDLVIRGAKSELRAYSAQAMHLLEVAAGATVKVEGLTLAEGSDGALVNYGDTQLRGVAIIDQTTRSASGIISNFGDLRLIRCELSFNTVDNAAQNAGTIVNYGFADIKNTRIRGNIVSRRFQSLVLASAILNYGQADLENVRLSDNEAVESFPAFSVSGKAQAFVNQGRGKMRVSALSFENNLPIEAAP
jgi:hypothetical protein